MRKTLAIAARELQERWLLLVGGLALGFLPLALPAFGLEGDVVQTTGIMVAPLIGGFAALVAGWSMLARDAGDGRLAFLFGKPISWPAIWGGKWIAAGLLAGASGLVAAIPWMAFYPPDAKTSWWTLMADLQSWTFAVSLVVLIVGLANYAATAFRARSAWLAVDFALLPAAVWAVGHFVLPLVLTGVLALGSGWGAASLLLVPLAATLLVASAGQLAIGRTDLRRAHRALSVTFWAVVFSLLTASAAWLRWVERATPADLRAPNLVRAAPDGRWIYIEAPTDRGGWYSPGLLVDSASGRYLRTRDLGGLSGPSWGGTFSVDGRFAVKWQRADGAATLTLIDLQAVPPRTTRVALEASMPPGFLTVPVVSRAAQTALVVQQASISLIALPSGHTLASGARPPGWRVAAERFLDAGVVRLWLARAEWGPATPMSGPAQLLIIELTANRSPKTVVVPTEVPLSPTKDQIVVDDRGERLLTLEHGLVLRNGADGAVVARLATDETVSAARFLAGGRVVCLSRERDRHVLRTFGADGSPAGGVALDMGATGPVRLGSEVRPGQVVVAAGRPFVPFEGGSSVVVDVASGRVVERLLGLRPVPERFFPGDIEAPPAARATFPPRYFLSGSGQVIRINFATGERKIVAGPGAPKGERLPGF